MSDGDASTPDGPIPPAFSGSGGAAFAAQEDQRAIVRVGHPADEAFELLVEPFGERLERRGALGDDEGLQALDAELLVVRITGLDDAVGVEGEQVARGESAVLLRVACVRQQSGRWRW